MDTQSVPSETAPPASTPSILVVDDHVTTARSLERLLRAAGYSPVVCHTGADALEYASRHRPDAAMVDVHLSDLSGLVVSAKLRERLGDALPIIVVSGDTSMETLNSLRHVGATYFLSKPVHTRLLMERLDELLGPAGDSDRRSA